MRHPFGLIICVLLVGVGQIQGQTVESSNFRDHFQWQIIEATAGVVYRVEGGYSRASGIVVGLTPDGFVVATAKHVTSNSTGVRVELFAEDLYPIADSYYFDVRVVTSKKYDLALLFVKTREGPRRILPLRLSPLEPGVPILAVGCGDSKRPYVTEGCFLRTAWTRGGYDVVTSGKVTGGFSGGPVVSTDGEVVGMIVRGRDGEAWSIRPDLLHDFLRDEGVTFLVSDAPRPRSGLYLPEQLILACWMLFEFVIQLSKVHQ